MTGIRLYSSEADAGAEISITRLLIEEDSSDLFAGLLASKLGGDYSDVSMQDVQAAGLGDEVVASRTRLQTEIGAFEMLTYYVRQGRALNITVALGLPGRVSTTDIEPLVRLFAERTGAELAAAAP
jgi:hypothetical protein